MSVDINIIKKFEKLSKVKLNDSIIDLQKEISLPILNNYILNETWWLNDKMYFKQPTFTDSESASKFSNLQNIAAQLAKDTRMQNLDSPIYIFGKKGSIKDEKSYNDFIQQLNTIKIKHHDVKDIQNEVIILLKFLQRIKIHNYKETAKVKNIQKIPLTIAYGVQYNNGNEVSVAVEDELYTGKWYNKDGIIDDKNILKTLNNYKNDSKDFHKINDPKIINELTGIKKDIDLKDADRPLNDENTTNFLKAKGWNSAGSGTRADVYINDNYDYALKIFNRDAAYVNFIRYCKKNNSKHLPKFKGDVIKINSYLYGIRVEKLQPNTQNLDLSKLANLINTDYSLKDNIKRIEDNIKNDKFFSNEYQRKIFMKSYIYIINHCPEILEVIYDIIKTLSQFDRDFHSGNIMFRKDGTCVIIDPVS